MLFVFCLTTHLTQKLLVSLTEHLQEPLVIHADPFLQVLHWVDQLVDLQTGHSLVRLQVGLTVGGQTHQTGLQSPELPPNADITRHLPRPDDRLIVTDVHHLKNTYNVSERCVDTKHRSYRKCLLAQGTLAIITAVPVLLNTTLTVVVSTGCGHWVSEEL